MCGSSGRGALLQTQLWKRCLLFSFLLYLSASFYAESVCNSYLNTKGFGIGDVSFPASALSIQRPLEISRYSIVCGGGDTHGSGVSTRVTHLVMALHSPRLIMGRATRYSLRNELATSSECTTSFYPARWLTDLL